ncbi:hypothetical protein [Kaistia terrae]|uniref:Uncharacterized protein n=1 Tax=Kaistia terrae TaxID=537017 RepID=A0ABW0Q309_9HYPH|nr:hypothetical protein [Kaistia terrae]MCX5581529.1 hypothetical protein [Kaistia terrae]
MKTTPHPHPDRLQPLNAQALLSEGAIALRRSALVLQKMNVVLGKLAA